MAQHVVPHNDGWAVRKGNSNRITRKFDLQQDAIDAATRFAQNQRTELFIHDREGRIRDRRSYGNDPRQIPG